MEYLHLFSEEEKDEIQRNFNTHWASAEDCVTEGVFMMFHMDRDLSSEEVYHIKDFSKHLKKSEKKRRLLLIKDFWVRK